MQKVSRANPSFKRDAPKLALNSDVKLMNYIDDYSSCERTYATLRIYPTVASPSEVSELIHLKPSHISIANAKHPKQVNGWFLSSEGVVNSKDFRRHIDWLLDQVEPFQTEFLKLTNLEAKANISCYWLSSQGHGGPVISPYQMKRLVKLNLSVDWDVYA